MACFARRREGDNPPRKDFRIATGTITGSRDSEGAGDGGSSFRLLNGSGCQISSVGFISVGDGGHEIESYELDPARGSNACQRTYSATLCGTRYTLERHIRVPRAEFRVVFDPAVRSDTCELVFGCRERGWARDYLGETLN